jgi:hypothetical protein
LLCFSCRPSVLCSFKWIPQDLRILAGNLVGIGWGTFVSVSCINSQQGAGAAADASATCPGPVVAAETVSPAYPAVVAAVEGATVAAR